MTLSFLPSRLRRHAARHSPPRLSIAALALACLAAASGPAAAQTSLPREMLPHDLSPWGMFMAADWVVKAVMIGLAFASVVTWTVWVAKSVEIAAARRSTGRTLSALAGASSLEDARQSVSGRSGAADRMV